MQKKDYFIGAMIIFICFVFIQSLFFKFTGAAETQHIFRTLDLWAQKQFGLSGLFLPPGPFNAYVIGGAELIASVVLLTGLFTNNKIFIPCGAIMAIGIISGAIIFHVFTPLGIEVQGDGGTLFFMACTIWICSALLIYLHKKLLLVLFKKV